MSSPNPKVDFFFGKAKQWKEEYAELRKIALSTGLLEELKWGVPCYTYKDSNVVLIHGFKEYCAMLFVKGALLDDPKGILIQQTKNVQSGRQIRFKSLEEINDLEPAIRSYIKDAIEIEKKGLKVQKKKTGDYPVAEEFQEKLDKIDGLKEAFKALTPGRQRAYLFYFSQPKTSKTRTRRVEENMKRILDGKGLND